jgi:hypothetical protein
VHKVRWQSYPKAVLEEDYNFPDELVVIERKPNKELIKERLKAGEAVLGARLDQNVKMILS